MVQLYNSEYIILVFQKLTFCFLPIEQHLFNNCVVRHVFKKVKELSFGSSRMEAAGIPLAICAGLITLK